MTSALSHRFALYVAIGAILILALGLRLFGHNWDDGWYQQPDERFIALVLTDHIQAPSQSNLWVLLDSHTSPLNPRADGDNGKPATYAYGTLPLYVTDFAAFVAGIVTFHDYHNYAAIGSIGRYLSTLCDVLTTLLTIIFASRAFGRRQALLAGLFVATSVILIQLAHFMTVDAWVTLFATATILASLMLWQDGRHRWALIAGLCFGMALASKISVVTLGFPILVASLAGCSAQEWPVVNRTTLHRLLLAAGGTVFAFALFEPYTILAPHPFIRDMLEQWRILNGSFDVPYTRQFSSTIPGLYQLRNLVHWGLGPALGFASLAGVFFAIRRLKFHRSAGDFILIAWIIPYFILISLPLAKYLRYVAPIVPALVILASVALIQLIDRYRGRLWKRRLSLGLLAVVIILTSGWTIAFEHIYTVPHTRVAASEWIFSHIPRGSTITAEYWDDALPLPLLGHDPSQYKSLTMDLYADKPSEDEFDAIASSLKRADYIILSSNRLASSIPKEPWRYPVQSTYYRLLESGQLGFQLVYQATDYPRIGPLTFPDQSADESFRVYDHPEVRIYKKVTSLDPTSLHQRFASAIAAPSRASNNPPSNELLLNTPLSQIQPATDLGWSAGVTHFSLVAIVFWLVGLLALTLCTLPLTLRLFHRFSDGGIGFAPLIGLLSIGFVVWLLASLRLIRFDVSYIFPIMAVVAAISWLSGSREQVTTAFRSQSLRRVALVGFGAFLLVFAILVLIRAINPDLWQTYYGGEKPMEMAYIDAIARSPHLPPYDPWYSQGIMNYYYYGFYLVALLWKVTGVPPEIGFQLAVATIGALLATGLYSLLSTLTLDLLKTKNVRWIIGGGLAGIFVCMGIGNFDALMQVVRNGGLHINFWNSRSVVSYAITEFPYFSLTWADLHPHIIVVPIFILFLALIYSWIQRRDSRDGPSGWVWFWSLAVAVTGGSIALTNYWDMPMVLALGAAGLFTAWAASCRRTKGRLLLTGLHFVGLIVLARLLFFPFFSHFVALVQGIRRTSHGTAFFQFLDHFGNLLGIVVAAGLVVIVNQRGRWRRLGIENAIGALVGLAGFIVTAITLRHDLPSVGILIAALLLAIGAGTVLPFVALRVLGQLERLWLRAATVGVTLLGCFGIGALAPYRFTGAVLLGLLLIAIAFWYCSLGTSPASLIGIGLAGAFGITLVADLIYIVDDLSGSVWERMNTVFKFYMEAWSLLSIAAALGLVWIFMRWRATKMDNGAPRASTSPKPSDQPANITWQRRTPLIACCISVLLLICGLGYPILGTPSRLAQRMNGSPTSLTLNGFSWMESSTIANANGQPISFSGDLAAINWLRQQVDGHSSTGIPVVLEAAIGPYRGNGSRISSATGLPTLVGWDSHEIQQRPSPGVAQRMNDVREIYNATDLTAKLNLLFQYDVRYVIVGDVERRTIVGSPPDEEPYASPAGLSAFQQLVGHGLSVAFRSGDTVVYAVTPFPKVAAASHAGVTK